MKGIKKRSTISRSCMGDNLTLLIFFRFSMAMFMEHFSRDGLMLISRDFVEHGIAIEKINPVVREAWWVAC
jgi:hypothetical protein